VGVGCLEGERNLLAAISFLNQELCGERFEWTAYMAGRRCWGEIEEGFCVTYRVWRDSDDRATPVYEYRVLSNGETTGGSGAFPG
jgi:hypothetical protein